VLPEVTSRKSRDRKRPWPEVRVSRPFFGFSRFFLTIVVVQNVPLRMTGSSMATGCDVTESDRRSRDRLTSPEVTS